MKKKNMLSKIIQNEKKNRLETIDKWTEKKEKSEQDIAKEKASEFYNKQTIIVSRIQDAPIAEIYKGIIDHYREMIDKDLLEAISVTSEEYFARQRHNGAWG